MNKSSYIQGETAVFSVPDGGELSAHVLIGLQSHPMARDGGKWVARISTQGMLGNVRYAVFVANNDGTTCSVESGRFAVRALVSKYRAVVDEILKALEGVATNGKYSVTVGEISLTDKTFDEMMKALSFYRGLAEEEEEGESSSGRVWTINTEFA